MIGINRTIKISFMEMLLFRLPKIGLKYRRWAVGHPPLEHQNRAG
jgi:hypothetical protein